MQANQIIDRLGGTTKVAALCAVTVGAVSQWRAANRIPAARLMYLQAIRPDVFAKVGAGGTATESLREVA